MNFIWHSRKLNKFLWSRIVLLLKHMLRHFSTKFLTPFSMQMLNLTKLALNWMTLFFLILFIWTRNAMSLPISLSFLGRFLAWLRIILAQAFEWKHSTLLQDILVGMIQQNSPSSNLLNYLIMIGKLYLWGCRRSQILPNIYRFKKKIALKYETEKYISLHSKKT